MCPVRHRRCDALRHLHSSFAPTTTVINVYLKRIWYACFGALHGKARQALGRMNRLLDEEPVLRDADPEWLTDDARRFGETFAQIEVWRARQICHWLQAYGREPFRDIAMWSVDWQRLIERFEREGDNIELSPADFDGVDFARGTFMAGIEGKQKPQSGKTVLGP